MASCHLNTVKPVLSGHSRAPGYCSLNRGVRLAQVHFTENKGRKKLVFTETGVCFIRGPPKTGFTVIGSFLEPRLCEQQTAELNFWRLPFKPW